MNITEINNKIAEIQERIADSHLCEGTASTILRITGYFRAVECFNAGKQAEYAERVEYKTY